jgi:predicted lipoprotein
MSDGTTRKRDRLIRGLSGLFKLSEAPKDNPSKKTKEKNTGNSQTNPSTATSIVKAQSLWSTAFDSNELDDQERETLKVIDFQANAYESVSKARSSVENLLKDKREKAPKIEKLLNWMDRFKEIGDIVVQFDPVHAALPWAAVRLLLKVDYTARSLDWTC